MQRRTRRTVTHLAVFLGILALLLLVNRPPSTQKSFAWTKIRYQTTAPSLPASHGRCPGLKESSKPALVVSHVNSDGDTSWLTSSPLSKKYHLCIYTVDSESNPKQKNAGLQVPANRAHEAMAYLTFLIDNYDNIPRAGAVFIHGSRWAWHNDAPDYDNAALLADLDVAAALQPAGYHNLRCDWSVSTCSATAPPQGSLQMAFQSAVDPWDARAASDAALPRALAAIFGGPDGEVLGRHETVRAQCCAQFVVASERVRSHSREEYVALRQWLLDSGDTGVPSRALGRLGMAPRDDRLAGRIVSYIWHILFLDVGGSEEGGVDLDVLNSAACPSAQDCYCRLYGRCDTAAVVSAPIAYAGSSYLDITTTTENNAAAVYQQLTGLDTTQEHELTVQFRLRDPISSVNSCEVAAYIGAVETGIIASDLIWNAGEWIQLNGTIQPTESDTTFNLRAICHFSGEVTEAHILVDEVTFSDC
ncbi:hypothetical protein BDW62DRAFT_218745 [Aspergillus aurantiobrunneus]